MTNNINNYLNRTDEELVKDYKWGDKIAGDILINRYDPIVKKYTRKFFLIGGDENDIFQEGMIGLFKAMQGYNEKATANFKTFAILCIKRQLITAIKISNRQKNAVLNKSISINATIDNEYDESSEIVSVIKDVNDKDPSNIIIEEEFFKEFNDRINNALSDKEKAVFNEFKNGKSYKEIASTLNCKVKSVDTAITRIRKKAKKINAELNGFSDL